MLAERRLILRGFGSVMTVVPVVKIKKCKASAKEASSPHFMGIGWPLLSPRLF
jgi:hypothetical protein